MMVHNNKMSMVPTFCGSEVGIADLSSPTPGDIAFSAIARSLSRIPRFNGIKPDYTAYSVAQHSVVGADQLARDTGDHILAAYYLLHDAHEAFVGDITRPVAIWFNLRLGQQFASALADLKHIWDKAIWQAAGLPAPNAKQNEIIRITDNRQLEAEKAAFFTFRNNRKKKQETPLSLAKIWGSAHAEEMFLDRLNRYLGI